MKTPSDDDNIYLDLREAFDMTQETAAQKLQIARNTWRSWEKGRRKPGRKGTRRLMEVFQIKPGQIPEPWAPIAPQKQ